MATTVVVGPDRVRDREAAKWPSSSLPCLPQQRSMMIRNQIRGHRSPCHFVSAESVAASTWQFAAWALRAFLRSVELCASFPGLHRSYRLAGKRS